MSHFRLFVFDLDGTLIDSRRDIADAANALLESCGAEPLPEDEIGRMVGDGAAVLVARAFAARQIEGPSDALDRFLALYSQRLLAHTRPYDGIDEVLGELGSRSALAVLTNKPLASTRAILDGLGLSRHFPASLVIGGDGPFPRKPDPAGLHFLCNAVHARNEETLLVGDSVIDWRTARAAGTSICMARYGFGFERFPVEDLTSDEFSVDTPTELLRM